MCYQPLLLHSYIGLFCVLIGTPVLVTQTLRSLEILYPMLSSGHFLLTYLLLDLIKRSTPARIIIVASVAHTWTGLRLDDINSERSYDTVKAYGQSKLANVLFARSLAKRLQGEVRCHVIEGCMRKHTWQGI